MKRLIVLATTLGVAGCPTPDDSGAPVCDADSAPAEPVTPILFPALRQPTSLGLAGAEDITTFTGERPTTSTWDGRVLVRACTDPDWPADDYFEEPEEGQPGIVRGQYWCFHAFRPGLVTIDADGVPQFGDAIAPGFQSTTRHLNASGGFPVVENQSPAARWNPYQSTADGVACGVASLEPSPPPCPPQRYETYDIYMVHSVARNSPTALTDYPDLPVGPGIPTTFEQMLVVVQDPVTDAATVVDVIRDSEPYPMVADPDGFGFVFGENYAQSRNPYLFQDEGLSPEVYVGGLVTIEPGATNDGRMVIFNGGDEDRYGSNLIYTWNPNPAAQFGWSPPKNVAYMHWVEGPGAPWGETMIDVDGEQVPFSDVFPIAKQPLRDHEGVPFDPGSTYAPATKNPDPEGYLYLFDDAISYEHYKGAYPWISWDGRNIMSLAIGRFNVAVIGDLTGYREYWIDGFIDKTDFHGQDAHQITAMWGLGQWPGRWAQYGPEFEGRPRTIPTRLRDAPTWVIFEQDHYSEISFHKTDGSYAAYFPMSRMRMREGLYAGEVTPDVSGHFNNGTFVRAGGEADFSQSFSEAGFDEGALSRVFGFSGQSVGFVADASDPDDEPHIAADALEIGGPLTVEGAVYLQSGTGLSQGPWTTIAQQPGAFSFGVNEERVAWFEVIDDDGTETRVTSASTVPENTWVHVAGVYDGNLRLYVDGALDASAPGTGVPVISSGGALYVGPKNLGTGPGGHGQVLLDEVGVTAGVRTDEEIAHSAFKRVVWPTDSLDEWEQVWGDGAMPLGLADPDGELLAPIHLGYPLTGDVQAKATLGEQLFHDTALSTTDPRISCESCHRLTQEDGGARAGEPVSEQGAGALTRHTPTVYNRVFGRRQFWDGRAGSLGEQLLFPIQSDVEMDMPLDVLQNVVLPYSGYGPDYCDAFGGSDTTLAGLQEAIAVYESGLVSGNSAVDRHRLLGEDLPDEARRGLALFATKGRCIGCHPPPTYTDERFHDNAQGSPDDPGRAMATARAADHGRFRTMSLRDVARTPPYMHDGSVPDLRAVVEGYDAGGDGRHPEMKPLFLSDQEVSDLVAFMEALTSEQHVVPLR